MNVINLVINSADARDTVFFKTHLNVFNIPPTIL